VCKDDVMISVF